MDQFLRATFASVLSALNGLSLLLSLSFLSGFGLLSLFGFTSLKHLLFPLYAGVLLELLLLELASLALGSLEPCLLKQLVEEVILFVLAALGALPVAALGRGHAVSVRVVRGVGTATMATAERQRRGQSLLEGGSGLLVDRR